MIEGIESELVQLRESTAQMTIARGASLIDYADAFLEMMKVESKDKFLRAPS